MKEIVSNLAAVLRKNLAFFAISLLAFALLYSFFYGIFTIPVLEIGFFKDVKPGVLDYSYIVLSSLISATIVTLTKYSAKNKMATRGAASLGIASGAFATICPVCLGINFLVFGSFITLPLVSLVPYAGWLQLAGLAVLAFSLWLTVKSSYENICLACTAKTDRRDADLFGAAFSPAQKYIFAGLLIIALFSLGLQIIPTAGATQITGAATDPHGLNVDEITLQVLPEKGFTIDARWGDSVSKMVKAGVLDVNKLNDLLTKRYGQPLTAEQKKLLTDDYSEEKLAINSKNAVFVMYVLWTLAKHDDNQILLSSPFASSFKGYDIGVGKAGYGDTKLIELTPEQQDIAKYVALNSYRPCCGNPTGHPDCSHGFSALGLIELMANQGYTKEQIFDAFVKFNSFWFPSTYIQDALYFKLAEKKDWNDVSKELVAGKQYSSLSGSYAVKKYLQELGL
ncbi:MAG: hypothetical protein HYT72_03935 [Candidatus Aenigmarchaeota archaeon]|nr:hypothetical protein [Candidatus Aenigmarchaeota archaeon]